MPCFAQADHCLQRVANRVDVKLDPRELGTMLRGMFGAQEIFKRRYGYDDDGQYRIDMVAVLKETELTDQSILAACLDTEPGLSAFRLCSLQNNDVMVTEARSSERSQRKLSSSRPKQSRPMPDTGDLGIRSISENSAGSCPCGLREAPCARPN